MWFHSCFLSHRFSPWVWQTGLIFKYVHGMGFTGIYVYEEFQLYLLVCCPFCPFFLPLPFHVPGSFGFHMSEKTSDMPVLLNTVSPGLSIFWKHRDLALLYGYITPSCKHFCSLCTKSFIDSIHIKCFTFLRIWDIVCVSSCSECVPSSWQTGDCREFWLSVFRTALLLGFSLVHHILSFLGNLRCAIQTRS